MLREEQAELSHNPNKLFRAGCGFDETTLTLSVSIQHIISEDPIWLEKCHTTSTSNQLKMSFGDNLCTHHFRFLYASAAWTECYSVVGIVGRENNGKVFKPRFVRLVPEAG